MILAIFAIVLILGFMAADAMLDYIFVLVYALAAMSIANNIIHLIKYYRKHRKIYSGDITSSLLFLLMAVGLAVFQHIFL